MVYVTLVKPEIPQNTGNVARTCMVTGSVLLLVHPLGFSLSERAVKRSGMDYRKDVTLLEEESFSSFEKNTVETRCTSSPYTERNHTRMWNIRRKRTYTPSSAGNRSDWKRRFSRDTGSGR